MLPESVARAMIGPAKAWMARINAPTMSVPLALCMSGQQALSAPALLVKDMLLSIAGGRGGRNARWRWCVEDKNYWSIKLDRQFLSHLSALCAALIGSW